jgi:hypothetical protein
MYFNIKNYLKNNRNYTAKHALYCQVLSPKFGIKIYYQNLVYFDKINYTINIGSFKP